MSEQTVLVDTAEDLGIDDLPPKWPGFIADDSAAQWAIRKIRGAMAELDRLRHNAQEEAAELNAALRAIDAKLDADSAGPRRTIEFMESLLVAYRRRLEAEDPDLPKTYRLARANLVRRKGRERTTVTDEGAFVTWALDRFPEAVKASPLVSVMGKWGRKDDGTIVSPDGEAVPGVQAVRADDTYAVVLEDEEPES